MNTYIEIVHSAQERKDLGMKRYGLVEYPDSLHREFIMLRGSGCGWSRCTFCDYCADKDTDIQANYRLNRSVLKQVTGKHQCLQIVSSGSFSELDFQTITAIQQTVHNQKITHLILETHTMYERQLPNIRALFPGVIIDFIVGAETFDLDLRTKLNKGHGQRTVADYTQHYQWTNILFGFEEQDALTRLESDVYTALEHFKRFTICIFCDNDTAIKRDQALIDRFYNSELFQFLTTNSEARFKCEILDDCDTRAPHTIDGVGGIQYD